MEKELFYFDKETQKNYCARNSNVLEVPVNHNQ